MEMGLETADMIAVGRVIEREERKERKKRSFVILPVFEI